MTHTLYGRNKKVRPTLLPPMKSQPLATKVNDTRREAPTTPARA